MILSLPTPALSCEPPSTSTSDRDGCIDYQMRMALSPLTTVIVFLAIVARNTIAKEATPFKRTKPLWMIVPYGLGRFLTGYYPGNANVQLLFATPLLAIGYAWGYVSLSGTRTMRAVCTLLGTYLGMLICMQVQVENGALRRDEEWTQTCVNLIQLFPMMIGVSASLFTLARAASWLWFVGLFWGIAGPIVIQLVWQVDPYDTSVAPTFLAGTPALWLSDSIVTLPLVFVGQLVEVSRDRVTKARKRKGA